MRQKLVLSTLCALLGAWPAPSAATPARKLAVIHTQHFVLKTDAPPALRAHLAKQLDDFRDALDTLLRAATDVAPFQAPLTVVVYEDARDYAAHARTHAPRLVHNGGYYDGANRQVVTYRRSNALQVIFHEVAHAVIGDLFADPRYERYRRPRWPIWFDEGLAEYVSSYDTVGGDLRFGTVHAARLATALDMLERRQTISLGQLLQARPARFSGNDKASWYASAWALVDLLLADDELRPRVHRWVAKLRAGADGYASFVSTMGLDLATLRDRLAKRVRQLSRRPVGPLALTDPTLGLAGWTQHEGGSWTATRGQIEGVSDGGWDYLTRAVPPLRSFRLELSVRRDGGAVGVVLGDHRAGAYPYHTLIDIGAETLTVRKSPAEDRVIPLLNRPVPAPPGQWLSLMLALDDGILSGWRSGKHVFSVPLERPVVSLVGVYLRGGSGGFRDATLTSGPQPGQGAASPQRASAPTP